MAFSAPVRLRGDGIGTTGQSTLPIATSVTGAAIGDLVVVLIGFGLGSTPSVSAADSAGNTWTKAVQADKVTGNTPHSAILYSVLTATITTAHAITAAFGTAVNYPQGLVYKSTPTASTTVTLDQVNTGTGVSTAPAAAAITTTGTDEILFAAVCTGAPQVLTAGTGWTLVDSNSAVGANKRIDGEYRIESATGTFTADGTITSADWADCVASFKATATVTGSGQPPTLSLAGVGP